MAGPKIVYEQNLVRVSIDEYNEAMAEEGLSVMDGNGNNNVDPEDIFIGASDFEGSLGGKDRVRAMCRDWRPEFLPSHAHFDVYPSAKRIIEQNGDSVQFVVDKEIGYVVHLVEAGFEFYLDLEFRKEFTGCNYYDFLIITKGIMPNHVRLAYRDTTGIHLLSYNTKNGKMWQYKWDKVKKRARWKRMETPKEAAAKQAKLEARIDAREQKKAAKSDPTGKKD